MAATLAGSVYLGWHCAVHGYLSIMLVSLIWWGVGWLAARERVPMPATAPAAAE